MLFEDKITENKDDFIAAVSDTSEYLQVLEDHLMFLMWFETARTLDHRKVNFQKGDDPDPFVRCEYRATGLIQFMPKTAIYLGTTNSALIRMSNVEQMAYVWKHLAPFRGKYSDYVDLYCAIFWPAAVGKPDSFLITSDIVAKQNPIFDLNRDTDISKSEIRQALYNMVPSEHRHLF